MKTEKSRWLVISELILMAALAVAIILLPKFNQAGQEESLRLNGSGRSDIPASDLISTEAPLAFIDHAIHEFSSWDADRLVPLLAEETREEVSQMQLNAVVSTLEYSLGELETYSYPVSVGNGNDLHTDQQPQINVYQIDAVYESGVAEVELHIVEENGRQALRAIDLSVDGSGHTL